MIVYLLLLFLIFAFAWLSKYTKRNKLFWLAFLLIFCFSAFRFNIGWDYSAYYRMILGDSSLSFVKPAEVFSYQLILLSQKTGIYSLYFIVNSFITIYLFFITINKYSQNKWFSLIFFLCFPLFFLNSLSVVRFFTALAISFYGYKYLEKENMWKYFVTIAIATLFHSSAIIGIPMYLLRKINFRSYKSIAVVMILPLISIVIRKVVITYLPIYATYLNDTTYQEGTKAIVFFVGVLFLLFLFQHTRVYKENALNTNCAAYNYYFMGICIYLMFFSQGTLGHRMSLYGTIYSVLLIPEYIETYFSVNTKRSLYALLYIFCIVAFVFTVYVGSKTYIPYRTIWS